MRAYTGIKITVRHWPFSDQFSAVAAYSTFPENNITLQEAILQCITGF